MKRRRTWSWKFGNFKRNHSNSKPKRPRSRRRKPNFNRRLMPFGRRWSSRDRIFINRWIRCNRWEKICCIWFFCWSIHFQKTFYETTNEKNAIADQGDPCKVSGLLLRPIERGPTLPLWRLLALSVSVGMRSLSKKTRVFHWTKGNGNRPAEGAKIGSIIRRSPCFLPVGTVLKLNRQTGIWENALMCYIDSFWFSSSRRNNASNPTD